MKKSSILIAMLAMITSVSFGYSSKDNLNYIDNTFLKEKYLSNDGNVYFRELRYRYRFSFPANNENNNVVIAIDYDFIPLVDMSNDEINELVKERVTGIEKIYSDASIEELTTSEGMVHIANLMNDFFEYKKSDEIYFMYHVSEYRYEFEQYAIEHSEFAKLSELNYELCNMEEVHEMIENDSNLERNWNRKYE